LKNAVFANVKALILLQYMDIFTEFESGTYPDPKPRSTIAFLPYSSGNPIEKEPSDESWLIDLNIFEWIFPIL
jgi:hypothetical protein